MSRAAAPPSRGPRGRADLSLRRLRRDGHHGGRRRQGCPATPAAFIRSAPATAARTVALTFDDGPGPFLPQILKILRTYDVRATFFDTGSHDAAFPALTRQIVSDGHLLADHTWDHTCPRARARAGGRCPTSSTRSPARRRQQAALTGRTPCYFRPPGGRTTNVLTATRQLGMTAVLWSVDPRDWAQPGHYSPAWVDRIVARATTTGGQAHPIVLLHDAGGYRGNTVAALPRIIAWYRAHGYRFVDLAGGSGCWSSSRTVDVLRRPALLDAAEPPDGERDGPGEHEEPDDPEADVAEVERGDPGQRPRLDAEPVDDQPGEHQHADDQGDGDRQQRDGQVVEDLAHRLEERPAVGPGHQHAVGGVEQAHAGGEQHRQDQDRVPGQHERRRPGREDQQGDLGGGVEAQAHQQPDRVEVPRLAHPPGHPAEQPAEEAAVVQVPLELGLVVLAGAHPAEHAGDADGRGRGSSAR